MKLHSDPIELRNLISLTAQEMHLPQSAVERDNRRANDRSRKATYAQIEGNRCATRLCGAGQLGLLSPGDPSNKFSNKFAVSG